MKMAFRAEARFIVILANTKCKGFIVTCYEKQN